MNCAFLKLSIYYGKGYPMIKVHVNTGGEDSQIILNDASQLSTIAGVKSVNVTKIEAFGVDVSKLLETYNVVRFTQRLRVGQNLCYVGLSQNESRFVFNNREAISVSF